MELHAQQIETTQETFETLFNQLEPKERKSLEHCYKEYYFNPYLGIRGKKVSHYILGLSTYHIFDINS